MALSPYLGSLLKDLMNLLPRLNAWLPKSDNFCPTRDMSDLQNEVVTMVTWGKRIATEQRTCYVAFLTLGPIHARKELKCFNC